MNNSNSYYDPSPAQQPYYPGEEMPEEMPATEKDLAEDAPWKKIQQNTFTRWCNEHLRCVQKRIGDLQKDLSDGLKLISLLEVLSQKKMYRKYHPRPNFRQMKLENVSVALEFLEREHIKLVSIDSKAIVDGNLKLILGLIWTLILHYSISMPMWEDEDEEDAKKQTPKQRLLGWIQNKVPQLPITNFNRDWQDGKALGALVDNCAPGLCPDWETWDPNQPVENAREAMQQADDWLGVPQVIAPEEIVDPNVDEHSVMTYLSQFPKAKLKPGAPLRSKQLNPKKAKAYGPGIEPHGNMVLKPAHFTVETIEAGMGEVLVYIEDPEGHTEEVTVLFAGQNIDKSPFEVNVGMALGDASKVSARGPGLEPVGNVANKPTYFDIYTAGAGAGDVGVVIVDPQGRRDTVEVVLEDKGDNIFRCTYRPVLEGPHTIYVTFARAQIPKSPFVVNVAEACNPGACRAMGRGLQPKGVRVKEVADFKVYTKGAGTGELKVVVKGPKGTEEPVKVREVGDGVYECDYYPVVPGKYVVSITWGGYAIPRSPFEVQVGPEAGLQKVRAWGPGLETGVVGKSADFVVEAIGTEGNMAVTVTYGGDPIPKSPFPVNVAPPLDLSKVKVQGLNNKVDVGRDQEFAINTKGAGGQGQVDVKISSPSRRPIPCKVETGTSSQLHSVKYMPPEEGPYKVDITYDGHPVPGSPFAVEAVMPPDPSKVCAYGPGLKGGFVGKPAPFTIDTKGAGTGGLGLTVEGPCEAKIECQDNGDGSCSVSYLPTEPGEYAINILFAEAHIPGSPFKADIKPVFDPSKVTASGPGLERGKVGEVATFMVDCSKAGEAELTIEIISDSGVKAEVLIQNNSDGTYSITYIPSFPGTYTITIKYGGHPVPKFPARVNVDPAVDTSNVKVFGPGVEPRGVLREVTTEFTVDARSLTKTGGSHVKVRVINPSGAKTDTYITDNGDGTYRVQYTPFEDGVHLVEVTYDDVPVPKSPFRVGVTEGCDPSRAPFATCLETSQDFCLSGPGMKVGAGTGGLGLAIEGPSEAKMSCKDNKDGSCSVEYIPFTPGDYDVNITFGGRPIPGSPFRVPVKDVVDPSKVKCSGPGLGAGVRARVPQTFTVDCSKAGLAPLEVKVLGPTGMAEPVEVRDNGDGTHTVNYTPATDGPYAVSVNPFKIKVLPAHDASKVRASGPGLNASGIPASLPVEFTIDARDAGEGLLTVQILDPEGKPKEANIRDNGDGTYTVSYVPDMTGRYTITIKYGGDEIPYSPFRIHALPAGDASKCLVTVSIGGHGLASPGRDGQRPYEEATALPRTSLVLWVCFRLGPTEREAWELRSWGNLALDP
ncbi:hypothetical protein JRQ81_015483 [Phrynocephalus forsythii]|uniref:Calponin-homology (CH) domain-containing protein n=1 Tax=Phrynocephalus forsythii TaxID=171643 RepID=A0A9Q0XW01_9SAUR|nr:hypothetical protein JRQ81_015483 [Phrynocephalus forsythii]